MADIPLIVAFIAGLVSFLSPCILPIIPGFLAYLAGVSTLGKPDSGSGRFILFLNSVFFVFGFSVVFALLGVLLNTFLSRIAADVQTGLARLGGVIIILFGLSLVGLLHLPFLERGRTFSVTRRLHSRYATSFLFGAAFAAGWTPCVGAVLGSILGLALTAPGSAFFLLFAYSLGLGIPFLVVGLFASRSETFINRHAVILSSVSRLFGAFLILIGILAFTENLSLLANFQLVNRWLLRP